VRVASAGFVQELASLLPRVMVWPCYKVVEAEEIKACLSMSMVETTLLTKESTGRAICSHYVVQMS
jgi:hypothetical protein